MANYGYGSGQGGYGQGGGQGGGYGQSSNPYGQSGNPYGQQSGNPYAQQSNNPYAQQQSNTYGSQQPQSNPYGQPQRNPYGQGPGLANTQPRYDGGQNTGMANGAAGEESIPMGAVGGDDSHAILNDCQDIARGIDSVLQQLDQIKYLQQRSLDDPDGGRDTKSARDLRSLNDDTQALTAALKDRIQKIKGRPGANETANRGQIGRVQRKLQEAIETKQKVDADFRRKLTDQNARQYRIVRPDASEAEVRQASEDPNGMQVFSQALLQSDRRGQSQSALRAVQGRHEAIQKIERDFIELANLYQELNQQVVAQEAQTTQIQQQADNVQNHVTEANTQLDSAIVKARARNRKKWYCLGIVVAIILVIVIIILIIKFGTNLLNGSGGK